MRRRGGSSVLPGWLPARRRRPRHRPAHAPDFGEVAEVSAFVHRRRRPPRHELGGRAFEVLRGGAIPPAMDFGSTMTELGKSPAWPTGYGDLEPFLLRGPSASTACGDRRRAIPPSRITPSPTPTAPSSTSRPSVPSSSASARLACPPPPSPRRSTSGRAGAASAARAATGTSASSTARWTRRSPRSARPSRRAGGGADRHGVPAGPHLAGRPPCRRRPGQAPRRGADHRRRDRRRGRWHIASPASCGARAARPLRRASATPPATSDAIWPGTPRASSSR